MYCCVQAYAHQHATGNSNGAAARHAGDQQAPTAVKNRVSPAPQHTSSVAGKHTTSEQTPDSGGPASENQQAESVKASSIAAADVTLRSDVADSDAAAMSADQDPWHRHISRQLSDAEVAELRSASVNFADPDAAEEHPSQRAWKRGTWQVAGRTQLPNAPDELLAYGVKERLRTRWQEVHEVGVVSYF